MEFNIADLFESLADRIPDSPALVSGDRRLTYAELDQRANRLASFLASRGVGKGDHIGLHLYNDTEFVEGMLAALKLRAVPINLNYRYVAKELRYLCENADLVAAVTQRELAGVMADAARGLEKLRTHMYVEDDSGAEVPAELEAFEYEATLAGASPERNFEPRSGKDLYIIYTGGTTGMPKGVMWQHEDVFFAALQGGNPGGDPIEKPEELADIAADGGVNMLPCAPFIHGAAQFSCWICLFTGGKLVLQPGKSFDPKRVCQLIAEEEVNTITLVGDAMARPIVDELERGEYDTSSIVAVASAGAVLSPVVRDALEKLMPDALILNNFGASETGHQGSAVPGEDTGRDGRPSFFMDETNIVLDEDGKPLEPGSGKIGKLARGGRIPLGYYKDEKKTAERFISIDGKRYTVPGDFATVEEDGRITVYGRGSVCINTGGEKVFPEEVEEALKSHPRVFDALVVGVPDPKWMQKVAAVVELRDGASVTLEEIQAHCREHVAGYKVPRVLKVADKVQRFPSGKPDYTWAREVATAEAE